MSLCLNRDLAGWHQTDHFPSSFAAERPQLEVAQKNIRTTVQNFAWTIQQCIVVFQDPKSNTEKYGRWETILGNRVLISSTGNLEQSELNLSSFSLKSSTAFASCSILSRHLFQNINLYFLQNTERDFLHLPVLSSHKIEKETIYELNAPN